MNSTASGGPELIPVRMLNEFVYCPRLAYLEWVQGEFEDNADTVEGRYRHRRVDKEVKPLPPKGEDGTESDGAGEDAPVVSRSVMLSDAELGLIAKIDLVETRGDEAVPVDYKRGEVPDVPFRAYDPERVQICAQALLLRAHGYRCERGILWFARSRARVTIEITGELIQKTREAIRALRRTAAAGEIPPPLEDSPKCPRCSLVGICLPDEVHHLAQRGNGGAQDAIRRMAPARDAGLPLHVVEQGAYVRKRGDAIEVHSNGARLAKARLLDVSQVNLHGNVQISTQTMRELLGRGVPVCFFSFGGWFSGLTHTMTHKNVELRMRQFEVARCPERSLALARAFVAGKIRNSRTLLRRNHDASDESSAALRELARLARQARRTESVESLLGVEGAAARAYFARLPGMLRQREEFPFDFRGRNRRPPKDPVNAMLSFLYALLVRDLTASCLSIGFDPYLGFYHQPRYGKPALALDLAEEFRPLIADSTLLMIVNNGEVREKDFVVTPVGVSLTDRGRRQVIAAYERRMDQLVTHPVFGYAISYRRILYVQARLLARLLTGEVAEYPAFETR